MKKVYLVVERVTVSQGHGDNSKEIQLSQYGPREKSSIFPVFSKREDAEFFIKNSGRILIPEILEVPVFPL
jgi:hypothetical protein